MMASAINHISFLQARNCRKKCLRKIEGISLIIMIDNQS